MSDLIREYVLSILTELVSPVEVDDDTWKVEPKPSPGFGDYPGIDVKGYTKTLRSSRIPVTSIALVRKQFEKDAVDDERAPESGRPVDVVKAVKADDSYTNDDGVTYVPVSGLQENVARKAARAIADKWKGEKIDLVSTVESKSELANSFGIELSRLLGANFVPKGILKGTPSMVFPAGMSDKARASQQKSFDKNVEKGFAMKSVDPKVRNLIKLNMKASDDVLDKATSPDRKEKMRVLLVDDVITSGSTLDGAIEALDGDLIEVIGCAVIFKMEESR